LLAKNESHSSVYFQPSDNMIDLKESRFLDKVERGFKENKSDPCLLSKWQEDNVMLIEIYVDDCLVIGTEDRIAKLIDDLKKNGFNLKVENSLKDYLSCRVIETKNLRQITILQPHLINN
jgi:hypothetical protein